MVEDVAPRYARDLAAVASVLHLRFYPLAATSGAGCWLVCKTIQVRGWRPASSRHRR